MLTRRRHALRSRHRRHAAAADLLSPHARNRSFNAEAFKKFGATLSIVLKQSPILDDFAIELYHPEVSTDGALLSLRRGGAAHSLAALWQAHRVHSALHGS
jgi:hypothetical protein